MLRIAAAGHEKLLEEADKSVDREQHGALHQRDDGKTLDPGSDANKQTCFTSHVSFYYMMSWRETFPL